jgi:hypothetical protein
MAVIKPTKGSNGGKSNGADVGHVACRAEPGMFRDELLVLIDGIRREEPGKPVTAQVLVDADLVHGLKGTPQRGKPVEGYLRGGIRRVTGGIATVVLPQEGIPVGGWMLVKAEALARE